MMNAEYMSVISGCYHKWIEDVKVNCILTNSFFIILKLINCSCSSYPTRASYSGQVGGFRNPMKNELKTTAVFEIISNTDANFLNLHIDKARKTHDDKQLYLITHFTKQTLT